MIHLDFTLASVIFTRMIMRNPVVSFLYLLSLSFYANKCPFDIKIHCVLPDVEQRTRKGGRLEASCCPCCSRKLSREILSTLKFQAEVFHLRRQLCMDFGILYRQFPTFVLTFHRIMESLLTQTCS